MVVVLALIGERLGAQRQRGRLPADQWTFSLRLPCLSCYIFSDLSDERMRSCDSLTINSRSVNPTYWIALTDDPY